MQIRFINKTGTTYTVEIDGEIIEFTRSQNHIGYGNSADLSSFVGAVDQCVSDGNGFGDLAQRMNGNNLMRLLAARHKSRTIEIWKDYYSRSTITSFHRCYKDFFGYKHDLTTCPNPFVEELRNMVTVSPSRSQPYQSGRAVSTEAKTAGKKETSVQSNGRRIKRVTAGWSIHAINRRNNMIAYVINGKQIEICLSGRPDLKDINALSEILSKLRTGLTSLDDNEVRTCIKKLGGKAAANIIGELMPDLAISFFLYQLDADAVSKRIPPRPHELLKKFFGDSLPTKVPFIGGLLDEMEKDLPRLCDHLITSSESELKKDCGPWVLFEREKSMLRKYSVFFPNIHPLEEEMKQFLRAVAYSYISSGKPYAKRLQTISLELNAAINSFPQDSISSVHDIQPWHIQSTILAIRKAGAAINYERDILFDLRRLMMFHDEKHAMEVIPNRIIPPVKRNLTTPLDESVYKAINQTINNADLPRCVPIAYEVQCTTGARADTLFSATTADLVFQNNSWILKLYYGKASEMQAKSGTPSYVYHKLPADLGERLQVFISETNDLRDLLDTPYIFIYHNRNLRPSSKRPPDVMTAIAFRGYMKYYLTCAGINDSSHLPARCSNRRIRAEVGRSMFAAGHSPEEVSAKLGNTALVANTHYNKRHPKDEAQLHRNLFANSMDAKVGQQLTENAGNGTPNEPMYGTCGSSAECMNKNDCRTCAMRIIEQKKEKGA